MGAFYIDDSVHDEAGFVIGACVYIKEEFEQDITEIITTNNEDPNTWEYKSNANYSKNSELIKIRSEYKDLLIERCNVGIVVLPRDKREELGKECVLALKQFIDSNGLHDVTDVYFDQGMFDSIKKANEYIDSLGFDDDIEFHVEQNSLLIRGIQIADLSAHLLSIKLKDAMGLIKKMVKAGKNSGYDPDDEMELGFEIFAAIRYCVFNTGSREPNGDILNDATVDIEPNGLFISNYCSEDLAGTARAAFGSFYLGCIH